MIQPCEVSAPVRRVFSLGFGGVAELCIATTPDSQAPDAVIKHLSTTNSAVSADDSLTHPYPRAIRATSKQPQLRGITTTTAKPILKNTFNPTYLYLPMNLQVGYKTMLQEFQPHLLISTHEPPSRLKVSDFQPPSPRLSLCTGSPESDSSWKLRLE